MGRVLYCLDSISTRDSISTGLCFAAGDRTMSTKQNGTGDRRHSVRFPLEWEVRYQVLSKRYADESGEGKTVNISSGGVLFTSQHELPPGRRVELSIRWPVQLSNKCALKLVARGRVVRFEEGRAAVEIQQHEFRTQASPSALKVGSRKEHARTRPAQGVRARRNRYSRKMVPDRPSV